MRAVICDFGVDFHNWSSPFRYVSLQYVTLHYLHSFPFLSNDNMSSSTPGDETPDSIGNSLHSEANRTSVAISNALVGELIMDSPSSRRSLKNSHSGVNRHSLSSDRLRELLEDNDMNMNTGPSWVTRGFNWWQKQKEQRQHEHLQHLADEQRRKLYEADLGHNTHNLADNSTFQQLTNTTTTHHHHHHHHGGGVENDEDQELHHHPDVMRLSTSGVGVSVEFEVKEDVVDDDFWVPEVEIEEEKVTSFKLSPYLLNQEQRQSIAVLGLPSSLAYCRWKRLYSLARDGDSFEAFLQLVQGHSHTLLVVRTTHGNLFGAYADTEWKVQHQGNPEFFGSAQAFLFRIDGNQEAQVYKWTGANRYIQFIDYKNSMLAFGGGGDVGAFGLCIEKDFQRGSSGTCATFGNEPLCQGEENFDIVDVECYGFRISYSAD